MGNLTKMQTSKSRCRCRMTALSFLSMLEIGFSAAAFAPDLRSVFFLFFKPTCSFLSCPKAFSAWYILSVFRYIRID